MISLLQHHTFALPAFATSLIRIEQIDELKQIDWNTPFIILGEGSNTVFVDDFQGQIIQIANKGISVNETDVSYIIEVSAGENWHKFVNYCVEQGMYGLENLALIPGTVGAAPVQNIGAYGVEVKDVITKVSGFDIVTGRQQVLTSEECEFAYRDSIFKHTLLGRFIITSVEFELKKEWLPNLSYGPLKSLQAPTAQQVMDEVIAIRSSKLPDPKIQPNSGSFFKNPIVLKEMAHALLSTYPEMPTYPVSNTHIKLAAGWLIEQANLKGYKIGGVEVSEKQALVLINSDDAVNKDLLAMITHIQKAVLAKFGVALEHEVRLIAKSGETKVEAPTCHK
ncbi:UDP-N-acetylmuramate dehydrogenase [Pseudoalteromonas sp. G4]|uniref:UDP-N-acetylmuramate dehydrogenase n=1 Tax=Pseudoalteromonas sp. G4 TaxID=2992761 RepID=UPI00237EB62B|nr:UDP-N-acetylmuramate dehydrogenase [Pseudoalteromonas sp. G4]MDE3274240.1 UDP-N-acetylmuramate dehydrogenase [Pseudoalteromonas sp. G4]